MPIQDPLTGLIIGCCFRVANELGPGFLEKVYENALRGQPLVVPINPLILHKLCTIIGPASSSGSRWHTTSDGGSA